jgi:hypothetical protein
VCKVPTLIVGYLLPCLKPEMGQTTAFAVRALCGIARSKHGMQLLLRYERSDALMATITGMLPGGAPLPPSDEDDKDGEDEKARKNKAKVPTKHARGCHGQVLSEVVIAIATLAQEKAWRWRLLDVTSGKPVSMSASRSSQQQQQQQQQRQRRGWHFSQTYLAVKSTYFYFLQSQRYFAVHV